MAELSKKEIIQHIVGQYSKPDQNLTPELVLRYTYTVEGRQHEKMYNTKTGEVRTENLWQPYRWNYTTKQFMGDKGVIIRSTTKNIFARYAKYHSDYEVLEIAGISIPANRALESDEDKKKKITNQNHFTDDKRTWEFEAHPAWRDTPRLFLFRGDATIYNFNGDVWKDDKMGKFYNKSFCSILTNGFSWLEENSHWHSEIVNFITVEAWKQTKMQLGYSNDEDLRVFPYTFLAWYKKSMPREKSKKVTELEEINQYITKDFNEYCEEYKIQKIDLGASPNEWRKGEHDYLYQGVKLVVFETLQNDWGVFRYILRNEEDTHRHEKFRLFISPKGVPSIYMKESTYWRLASTGIKRIAYGYYTSKKQTDTISVNFDKLDDVKHLKYLKSLIQDAPDGVEILNIVTCALRHPIIELMWKSGYPNIAKFLMNDNEVAANLKNYFGVKEKKGKLYEVMELNKEQLQYIEDYFNKENNRTNNDSYWNKYSVLKNGFVTSLRKFVPVDRLSDLSKESTKKYFDLIFLIVDKYRKYWRYNLLYTVDNNGIPHRQYFRWREEEPEFSELDRQNILHIGKVCKGNHLSLQIYGDIIGTYVSLTDNFRPQINVYEVTEVNLIQVHDQLNALLGQQQLEQRRYNALAEAERNKQRDEKIKKLNEKRIKDFEYKGDEYSIIVPKNCSEVVTEGTILSHCVGGYVERVAQGGTNILFLRKNDNIDTPFFTIEVNNAKQVVQIHGKHNSWLGTRPEAISFVVQWLKEKAIQCSRNILLCTSTGYSSAGQYLDGEQYGL